jgi:hypothetical protein
MSSWQAIPPQSKTNSSAKSFKGERSHEPRPLSSDVKILLEELYSTYDQCKKDAKTVTTWLATRSQQFRYQLEEFSEDINESAEDTKGRRQVGHHKLAYNASGSTSHKEVHHSG